MFYDLESKEWKRLESYQNFHQTPYRIKAHVGKYVKDRCFALQVIVSEEIEDLSLSVLKACSSVRLFVRDLMVALDKGYMPIIAATHGQHRYHFSYDCETKTVSLKCFTTPPFSAYNHLFNFVYSRFSTMCTIQTLDLDYHDKLASSFIATTVKNRRYGRPLLLKLHSFRDDYIQWDQSAVLPRSKLCLDMIFAYISHAAMETLLGRSDVYDILLNGRRLYTPTSFMRALYYQTTHLDAPPKKNLQHDDSPLGRLVLKAQEARIKQLELTRIALAFGTGRAWLDSGHYRLGRDVGSIIARHILSFQSSVLKMDIETPNIHDPRIRHYKSHLRHKRRRRR